MWPRWAVAPTAYLQAYNGPHPNIGRKSFCPSHLTPPALLSGLGPCISLQHSWKGGGSGPSLHGWAQSLVPPSYWQHSQLPALSRLLFPYLRVERNHSPHLLIHVRSPWAHCANCLVPCLVHAKPAQSILVSVTVPNGYNHWGGLT